MADQNAVIIPIELDTKSLDTALGGLDSKFKSATKDLGKSLSGLGSGIGDITKSFGVLNESLLALAANPIVLVISGIVVATKALYDAFASTEQGAEELSGVFGGFSEVGLQIRDILARIASVIAAVLIPIIKVITGVVSEFLSTLQDLVPAFKKTGDGSDGFSKTIKQIADVLQPVIGYFEELVKFVGKLLVDAFKIAIIPIKTAVQIFEDLWKNSKLFRDIVTGLIAGFRGLYAAGTQIIKVLESIADVVTDILTGNFKDVSKDIKKAMEAGQQVGQAFVDGANGVVKKDVGDDKSKAYSDAQEKIFKATKKQNELEVQSSEVQAKIAKLRLDAQKGIKGAAEEADKAEKDYNTSVLKNKEDLVAAYKTQFNLNKNDMEAKENLQKAETDLNNTRTQGYQNELRIARAESKLNKVNKAAKKEAVDAAKSALKELEAADEKLLIDKKKNSLEYYDQEKTNTENELKYLQDNYKKLGMTDGDYAEKRVALEKKLADNLQKIKDQQHQDAVDTDETNVLLAGKNLDKKYAAEQQKLLDNYNYEVTQEGISDAKKLLLEQQYISASNSLKDQQKKDEEDAQKARQDAIEKEDKDRIGILEKQIKLHKANYDELLTAEQKYHDDKAKILESAYQKELKLLEDKGQDTTSLTAQYNQQMTDNDEENSNAQIQISIAKTEALIANINKVGKVISDFSSIAGKNTEAGKALAIAQATISTYTGAAKAVELGFPAAIPALAATLAAGFANVKKIISVKVPGGKGSSGASPQQSSQPTQFAPPQLFGIGGTQINNPSQIKTPPQKVFVTEGDISRTMNKVNAIKVASIQGS